MAIVTLILGNSGDGKTHSLIKVNPENTLIVQPVKKSLPFRSLKWKNFTAENPTGSKLATDNYSTIHKAIDFAVESGKKRIVIDDSQYLLCNEMMRRSDEKGFDKFISLAKEYWQLIQHCQHLPDDVRVYFLSHLQTTDDGRIKPKTIGKLLDQHIVIEGLFTIVLRAQVADGRHFFSTKNNGIDCVKSPIDMFESAEIENCIDHVDRKICEYEGIKFDS